MSPGEIQLRISRRARRLRIDVSPQRGVVVVVPEGTPRAVVDRFVADKCDWIRRARQRVDTAVAARCPPDEPPVPDALPLRALGRTLAVRRAGSGGRPSAIAGPGEIRVTATDSDATARAALIEWLKREARRELVPRLSALAGRHGLDFARAAVRGQRTRWASCSARGTISLNYRLLFLPPALVDHVLLHELAHTRHLDHSRAFWALLARLDPDWRQHHADLQRAREWLPGWLEMDA